MNRRVFLSAAAALLVICASVFGEDLAPETRDLGNLNRFSGGKVRLPQGLKGVVYAARLNCSKEPPLYGEVMDLLKKDGFFVPTELGVTYDAGVGTRQSGACGGEVGVRAIGIQLTPGFVGQKKLRFFHDDVALEVTPPGFAAGPADPQDKNLGNLSLYGGGKVTLRQGSSGVVFPVRLSCSKEPPLYGDVIQGLRFAGFVLATELGTLYDAGIGISRSNSCGAEVGVRAIGVQLAPGFAGQKKLRFWDDEVTLEVTPQ